MNRIAELRKDRGLSQSELAEIIGVAQNTLSQYETETRKPTGKALLALADYFGVTTKYILGVSDDQNSATVSIGVAELQKIAKIKVVYTENDVNILLSLGWKLLHIGTDVTPYNDGSTSSTVVYTMGCGCDVDTTIPLSLDVDDPGATSLEKLDVW